MKQKRWITWMGLALFVMAWLAWVWIGTGGGTPWLHVAYAAPGQTTPNEANAFSCTEQTEIPQIECEALVIFFNTTNGPGWMYKAGWLETNTPCSWSGLKCANGHITEFNLYGGTHGEPGPVGPIPPELGNLTELELLNLANNGMSGQIPTSLGNLTKLRYLDLYGNQLTGPIPTEFGNLGNLINLHMSTNQLSGTIPASLGNLTNLVRLDLQYNQLSGVLPPSLGNMTNLGYVFLVNNQLFGNIPSEFGNLANLKWFRISSNPAMQGELPLSLTNLTLMEEFWFDQSQLCAPINEAFQNWYNNIRVRYGSVCNLDLSALRLEVIQSVQDLNQSVRLVANKRTFVRFYARALKGDGSPGGNHATTASMQVQRGDISTYVYPKSYTTIVRPNVNRNLLDNTFVFELPDGFREGQVTLTATLNPYGVPGEITYDNNSTTTTINFETVPAPNVLVNLVTYRTGTTTHTTARTEGMQMIDWITRAFPVPSINAWYNVYDYTTAKSDEDPDLPTCARLNTLMALAKVFGAIFGETYPGNTRFYAMVTDAGGFVRGLSTDSPGVVACGPTGVPGNPNSAGASNGGWDTDGSYGDWYGGHELGHAYSRKHVRGVVPSLGPGQCGGEDGFDPDYTHANGLISTDTVNSTAFFGLDSRGPTLLPPTWSDVMTYCRQQWISEFTFEALMNFFQGNSASVAAADLRVQNQTTRLLVSGTYDPALQLLNLLPLYVIPDAGEVEVRILGPYAIVLRDEDNAELARYAFTPDHADQGPAGQNTPDSAESHNNAIVIISELVPFVAGTVAVDIEGPGGALLTTISASAGVPAITVTSPTGGESLNTDPITVSWTASDPDGDPLHFVVEYSADNGVTWKVVAPDVTENSVAIAAFNLPGGDQGIFRVWASDGLHTASDTSDALFTVPNHEPTVQIVEPSSAKTIVNGQPLALQAFAYDVEEGTMPAEQVEWSSDIDGVLGNGQQLTVNFLSEGLHIITVIADDGAGGRSSATVQVTVVLDSNDLPQVADAIDVTPSAIHFITASNQISGTLQIDNLNTANPAPLRWEATSSDAWVQLSVVSGTMPGELTLTFNDIGLPTGQHTAIVTLTSPDIPGQVLPVQVTVGEPPANPALVDALQATPDEVAFNPASGKTSETITIGNQNSSPIRWSASSSEPWVQLSATAGLTGDDLTLTFNNTGLAPGQHAGIVTLTSPDVSGQTLQIAVSVQIPNAPVPEQLFLPSLNVSD